MKPIFHIATLPRLVAARPGRPVGSLHRSAHHSSDVAPTAWLTSFTPWRPAPFLRVPPVADAAGQDVRGRGYDAAPVRRSDLLLQAERLRTLGR
jgi:hypothetical protein